MTDIQSTQCVVAGTGRRDLAVDIFRPQDGTAKAAVVLLHGGGWQFGHRSDMARYAKDLAGRGFVAIAAEYRLLGEAAWPAALNDVGDIVRWVADNAGQLGIDPAKIALEGFSAGGHLALLTAARSRQVAAVISFFAPTVIERPANPGPPDPISILLGARADDAAIESINPIAQIGQSFPPTFLLGGVDDPLVPPAIQVRFAKALLSKGTSVDLHLFHGHTHEFAALPSMLSPVQAEVALFLERAVVDPEKYRDENLALNMFARPGGFPPAA